MCGKSWKCFSLSALFFCCFCCFVRWFHTPALAFWCVFVSICACMCVCERWRRWVPFASGLFRRSLLFLFLFLFFQGISQGVCYLLLTHSKHSLLNNNMKWENSGRFLWRWRKEENKILSVDYALVCNGLCQRDKLTKWPIYYIHSFSTNLRYFIRLGLPTHTAYIDKSWSRKLTILYSCLSKVRYGMIMTRPFTCRLLLPLLALISFTSAGINIT